MGNFKLNLKDLNKNDNLTLRAMHLT